MTSSKFMTEIKSKTLEQLAEELKVQKKELFSLRLQGATRQLNDISKIKKVRRNIARIETVITSKKMEASKV